MIEQSFKFLNAFCLYLQYEGVFSTRQSLQINRAIVCCNAIQMMNMPSLWKRFIVSLFPHKYMLCYIALRIRSWIIWLKKVNVITVFSSSPFPLRKAIAVGVSSVMNAVLCVRSNRFAADGALFRMSGSPLPCIFSPSFLFCFCSHTFSIPQSKWDVK